MSEEEQEIETEEEVEEQVEKEVIQDVVKEVEIPQARALYPFTGSGITICKDEVLYFSRILCYNADVMKEFLLA